LTIVFHPAELKFYGKDNLMKVSGAGLIVGSIPLGKTEKKYLGGA
jgi:hypothetical protein